MKTKVCFAILALAVLCPAHAQPWPTKPVRVIVPFPAGGTSDVVTRTFTPRLTEEYGQQFIVDNRAGAGGTVGAEIGARANPDGYTLAVVPSSYAPNAVLYKLPYDPVQGIAPISTIVILPFLVAVGTGVKANTLKELIELARVQPGALNYASVGVGSTPHLAMEWFQQLTKAKLTHVTYKGDNFALTDLVSGQIQIMFATDLVLGPQIKQGRVRPLAVSTAKRAAAFPDLPAIGEIVPGFVADGWAGMFAPAGTPREVITRLNQSISRILKVPEVQERLRAAGGEPTASTPDEFAQKIARDIATWTKVVKDGNLKLK